MLEEIPATSRGRTYLSGPVETGESSSRWWSLAVVPFSPRRPDHYRRGPIESIA